MIFSRWLLWIHIGSLLANMVVYGIITFTMDYAFLQIFKHPESAPYYLTVYAIVLIFCLSLCGAGLVFGDIFGHKDLRAQIVSRGMLVIGVLASFLPITLITMWDMALYEPEREWSNLVLAAQHLGIWIGLVAVTAYACLMLLIYFLGKELSSIPKGWAVLSLALAIVGFLIGFSCLRIVDMVILFRIFILSGSVLYLVWVIWLAFIKKVERMP